MYRKVLKYSISVIALVVVVTNSVYLKKLDEVKATAFSEQFDATAYAEDFWNNKLLPALSSAIDLNLLIPLLESSPEETFQKYSNALGIGNIKFFLVKGRGKVTAIHENTVSVLLESDSAQRTVKIATEYIFGNAVRDASGKIDINEFDNTMDFNNVSAAINKIIRTEVLPEFNARIKERAIVEFTGAIELNKAHLDLENMEVVPVTLNILVPKNQKKP